VKHVNVHDVFSAELVEEIQKHYSGGYLFIPKRNNKERDEEMRILYKSGASVKEIARKVNLTERRVRQILKNN